MGNYFSKFSQSFVAFQGFSKGQKRKAADEGEAPEQKRAQSTTVTSVAASTGFIKGQKRKAIDDGEAPSWKRTKSTTETSGDASEAEFKVKYIQCHKLGEGGQGCVYAGYRKADHFPVAIKHIEKGNDLFVKANAKKLPLEVAIMKKLRGRTKSVGKSAAISLLDWYDLKEEVILVMERPVPCMDLWTYLCDKEDSMQECEIKGIMKQLVEAVKQLEEKYIFHRDIKVENILIETGSDVLRVRLIDFGLSCFVKQHSFYRTFYGTCAHTPPEWYKRTLYRAGPTTVWQLGVVLYEMLHKPTWFETRDYISKHLTISEKLPTTARGRLGWSHKLMRLFEQEDLRTRTFSHWMQIHSQNLEQEDTLCKVTYNCFHNLMPEASIQGTNVYTGSNMEFNVFLKDISTNRQD